MALAAASSAALFASGVAHANPHGGRVVAGSASINSSTPDRMLIDQTSSNAIINWQSFSIGSGQSVQFAQPSSSSATLNRITGGSQSLIDGLLSANGQVLILNPEGVLFGRSACVNVGGLVATTSDIANEDFMSGKLAFHATGVPGASVVNQGSIHVADEGLAALVAPTVANSGVIEARLGHIELASGETYTLDLYGDHLINFAIGQTAKTPTRSVYQSGQLIADGGQVVIASDSAAAVVSNVVNISGIIQARTVGATKSGDIVLEAPGANIAVTGKLDASGQAALSGGTISVKGAEVQVATSGSVDASASNQGNGGNVELWGTNSLAVAGNVTARGGSQGGDGGSLDLSTAGALSVTGSIDLQAPEGIAGSLLLDPASITVAAAGSSDPTASVVSAGFLDLQLQGGTNVSLSATDSITVDAPIDGRPGGGVASSHQSGSVSLTAGSLTIAAPIVADRAPITLDATGTAATGSGNIVFTSSDSSGSNAGRGFLWVADCSLGCATPSPLTIGHAPIVLAAGQNVSADSTASFDGQLATLGSVSIEAGGQVSLPALDGVNTASGTASGIGALTISAGGAVSLGGADTTGAVDVSGESITTGGNGIYSSSGGVMLAAGSGGITIGATTNGQSSGVEAAGGGNVALATTGAITIGSSVVAGGNLCIAGAILPACGGAVSGTLASAGAITADVTLQAGSATSADGISLLSSGNIDVSNLLLGSQGTVTLDASGNVSVQDPIAGYAGTGSVGSLDVEAGGDVSLAGANVGVADGPDSGATAVITADGNVILGGTPVIARDGISITAGGSVYIGSGAAALAGIGLDNMPLQTASAKAAKVSIVSGGSVTISAPVWGEGGIDIGSSSKRVSSVNASESVLQAGDPITNPSASVDIYAVGSVSLGTVQLGSAGAALIDTHAPASAADGSVSMSRGFVGLGGAAVGQVQIDANGSVTVPYIDASGDISITSYRSGAAIGTGANPASPDAWLAGGDVGVTSDAGPVTFTLPSSAGTPSQFASIQSTEGGVFIRGATDVGIAGAVLANAGVVIGNLQEDLSGAGSSPTLAGNGMTDGLTSSISVAQIQNGGPIASADPNVSSAEAARCDVCLASSGSVSVGAITGAPGSRVWAEGAGVTLGEVASPCSYVLCGTGATFLASVTVEGSVQTGGDLVLEGPIIADDIDLWTAPSRSITILGPLSATSGNVIVGVGADGVEGTYDSNHPVDIDLSNSVMALPVNTGGGGNIDFDGDVTLFSGVDRWSINPALIAPIPACGASSDCSTIVGVSTDGTNTPNFYHLTDVLVAVNPVFQNGQWVPQVLPSQPRPFNDTTTGCAFLACPTETNLADFQLSGSTAPELSQVQTFDNGYLTPDSLGWASALGAATSTIAGETVTFEGAVRPSLAANPLTFPDLLKIAPQTCGSGLTNCVLQEIPVSPSYMNVDLTVQANDVTFDGPVGAQVPAQYTPQQYLNFVGLGSASNQEINVRLNGMPALGYFTVNTVTANTTCAMLCASTNGTYVFQPVAGDSNSTSLPLSLYSGWAFSGGTGPTQLGFYYSFDDSNQGNQDIGVTPDAAAPGASYAAPAVPTAFGALAATSAGASAGGGISAAGAVAAAGFAPDIGQSSLQTAELLGGQTTATDLARQKDDVEAQTEDLAIAGEQRCPRGAGKTADLGLGSGVEGAAPDVFAQCGRAAAADAQAPGSRTTE